MYVCVRVLVGDFACTAVHRVDTPERRVEEVVGRVGKCKNKKMVSDT